MKRLVLTLAVALVTALSASAQRLANIQVEARFIGSPDKPGGLSI